MEIFERIAPEGYEQVVFCNDRTTGLRAIIAIHSTALGPALGGTRFYPYPTEDQALEDVLRLSRGMTYKAAVAGLDLGGGKAVILGDPAVDKNEALMRSYGRFVDGLGGNYITAEDVGTTQPDMDLVRRETRFVTGVSEDLGGSGDPSAATAFGVFWSMKAVARRLWGTTSLEGRHVVVAGVGKVGTNVARHLAEERARITVADVNPAAVTAAVHNFGAEAVPVETVHTVECDIHSPCALGGSLNATTIPEMRCAAVVGSANNQLADAGCARMLADAGILYAPDYVVNAGGIINIAEELAPQGYHRERAYAAVRRIFDSVSSLLQEAHDRAITTAEAADRAAETRISELGQVRHINRHR